MAESKIIRNASRREKEMAELIWLNYFNNYLYQHGTISEKEYKKMVERIATRKQKGRMKYARIQVSNPR